LIWFNVKESDIEEDFFNLFSKGPSTKPTCSSSTKQEPIKIIDCKRSLSIGVFLKSQNLSFEIVRDALISFDIQLLSYDLLNSIHPQDEEIRSIQNYLKSSDNANEELLDKPELFLLKLSSIPAYRERINCLCIQNRFLESITSIEYRLNNLSKICDELITSEKVKKILGTVLACGNSMNAMNKEISDADGFDLEILAKLKDVKSKNNKTNLLNYIVNHYVNKIDNDKTIFPLPDLSAIKSLSQTSFNELEKELEKLINNIKYIEQHVLDSNIFDEKQNDESLFEPFKSKIIDFVKNSKIKLKEQEDNCITFKLRFFNLVASYAMKPKENESEITLNYFFSIWATFINDFKTAWELIGCKRNDKRSLESDEFVKIIHKKIKII